MYFIATYHEANETPTSLGLGRFGRAPMPFVRAKRGRSHQIGFLGFCEDLFCHPVHLPVNDVGPNRWGRLGVGGLVLLADLLCATGLFEVRCEYLVGRRYLLWMNHYLAVVSEGALIPAGLCELLRIVVSVWTTDNEQPGTGGRM